jgi:hypothetical protein
MRARSYQASPGPAKASALCISLWMVPVNLLVNLGMAVEKRGCGKVDNRQVPTLCRRRPFPLSTGGGEIPTAGLWSLLIQRGHPVGLPFSGVADAQLRPDVREYLAVYGCVRAPTVADVAVRDTGRPSARLAGSRIRAASTAATPPGPSQGSIRARSCTAPVEPPVRPLHAHSYD